ncbi:MAG: peptidoglycan recognition protein family protein [Acetobacteraceae bacterium]|nr:peptidoglycan recognition protein family protein [Acetobacteraceae bacterium]
MAYEIVERLIPFSSGNRPGTPLVPREITSHRTGNPTADAMAHYRYFSRPLTPRRPASAHYFVDSGTILRIIPENERAYHAGPRANAIAIGIELCENRRPGTPGFLEAYRRYVWLHADICRRYGFDPRTRIRPHAYWDPRNRPDDPVGLINWQQFLRDVAKELGAM